MIGPPGATLTNIDAVGLLIAFRQWLALLHVFRPWIHHPEIGSGDLDNLTPGARQDASEDRRLMGPQEGEKSIVKISTPYLA